MKIESKIVDYRIGQSQEEKPQAEALQTVDRETSADGKVVRMHEKLDRPEMLRGSTYKVKTPMDDHAMYVTINDIVLNLGTEYESQRPFEIFV
jgi:hypothetical protein